MSKAFSKDAVSRKIHIELYRMTNRLRCVILAAGSRKALCGRAGFTIMLFNSTFDLQSSGLGITHMKKIIASLVTASLALVSVQAFAQASDAAPAAAATA